MLPPETKSQRSFWPENTKKNFWSEMAWNVFKIDSSKIGFYQNFLIYCDKFDNKIIYCLSRFRAGNFSPAPTSNFHRTDFISHHCKSIPHKSQMFQYATSSISALCVLWHTSKVKRYHLCKEARIIFELKFSEEGYFLFGYLKAE